MNLTRTAAQTKKILLAEDNEFLSSYLGFSLEEKGYAVDVAFDGDTAVEKLSINSYDYVYLDTTLPNGNGLEVCESINGHRKQHGHIAVMHKHHDETVVGKAQEKNLDGFEFLFNLRPSQILKKIDEHFSSR